MAFFVFLERSCSNDEHSNDGIIWDLLRVH